MLGNDFIPHIPTIDIKKDGLDMLIDIYSAVYLNYNKPIIQLSDNNVSINMLFLEEYIMQLSLYESDYIQTHSKKNTYIKNNFAENTIEKDLWELENMETIKYKDIYQPNIGNIDDWKYRYYKNVLNCSENHEQLINDMCEEYLNGLLWIAEYYFNDCPSWQWMFKYMNAPFLSDIRKFIKTFHYNPNMIKFDKGTPLKPLTQLMCVIPKQCNSLLPKKYRELMNLDNSVIGDLFPEIFDIDVYNKDMYWQCIPKLPHLDIDRINNEISKIQENELERKINSSYEDYIFTK
jgi:5'-3' exonuclease